MGPQGTKNHLNVEMIHKLNCQRNHFFDDPLQNRCNKTTLQQMRRNTGCDRTVGQSIFSEL